MSKINLLACCCIVAAFLFNTMFSACKKPVIEFDNTGADTTVQTDTTPVVMDSIFVIGVISGNEMATAACEYYSDSKKLSKLYFKGHASGDTCFFVYNKNGDLSYLNRKNISLYDGADEAYIFRHNKDGSISKVFFVFDSPEIIDTNNVYTGEYTQSLNYDSIVYDTKNRVSALYIINTADQFPLREYYELTYMDTNDSLLAKVVHTQETGGVYVRSDSILFTGYTNIPNPYYKDFKYYPFYPNSYYITFLPYGNLQQFMIWNKYLCATIKNQGSDGTKYLFYTLDANQMPVRYFIALNQWGSNGIYENYTACTYLKIPK